MPQNSFRLYQNLDGPVLGTVSAPILEQDGLFFKDLARTGQLLPYEDWRLDAQTRAEDLAARLSIEEIAGLMMYSPHQMIPTLPGDPFQGSYNGKPFPESASSCGISGSSGQRGNSLSASQRRKVSGGCRRNADGMPVHKPSPAMPSSSRSASPSRR